MDITTPIPALGDFMVGETSAGSQKRVMYVESTKFNTISRPGVAEAKLVQSLKLDFIVRAKSAPDALDLITSVWGDDDTDVEDDAETVE